MYDLKDFLLSMLFAQVASMVMLLSDFWQTIFILSLLLDSYYYYKSFHINLLVLGITVRKYCR